MANWTLVQVSGVIPAGFDDAVFDESQFDQANAEITIVWTELEQETD